MVDVTVYRSGGFLDAEPDDNVLQQFTVTEPSHPYRSGYGALSSAALAAEGSTPRVADVIGGEFYGFSGTAIHKSADGASWSAVVDPVRSSPVRLHLLGDGEVLLQTLTGLFRSSGWTSDPTTATFSQVLAATGAAQLWPWGVSAKGDKVIATEYPPGAADADSRYVRFSTDNGQTWATIFDLADHASDHEDAHMHFAEIDEYANDRLWTCWHDNPKSELRVLWSDDDGATWNTLTDQYHPTVAVATPTAMLFGSDNAPHGVWRALRTDDPADMVFEQVVDWDPGVAGSIPAYAYRGFVDERGVGYFGFVNGGVPSVDAVVIACDGVAGDVVWTSPSPVTQSINGVRAVAAIADGTVRGAFLDGGGSGWQVLSAGESFPTLTTVS